MTEMSWHQERAAGIHALPYDIVGYTYRADNYCPECIVRELVKSGLANYAERRNAVIDGLGAEEELDVLARMRGINRQDERSYDSGEFPKVLFRDQLQTEMVRTGSAEPPYEESIVLDRCCECRRVLGS